MEEVASNLRLELEPEGLQALWRELPFTNGLGPYEAFRGA